MVHSTLNRGLMLEWIEDRLAAGEPAPTDPEIMAKFHFATPEAARTLLADLADRGQITIRGTGAGRAIALGRKPVPQVHAPRPEPSVTKANRQVDKTVAKIMAIAQRKPASAPVPAIERKEPLAPRRIIAPTMPRVAPAPQPRRNLEKPHQVNIRIAGELYARVMEEAAVGDLPVSTVVTRIFERAMVRPTAEATPPPAPERKPLIRAAMVAAAQRDDFPLDAFVRILLERGFASYEADAAAERAA